MKFINVLISIVFFLLTVSSAKAQTSAPLVKCEESYYHAYWLVQDDETFPVTVYTLVRLDYSLPGNQISCVSQYFVTGDYIYGYVSYTGATFCNQNQPTTNCYTTLNIAQQSTDSVYIVIADPSSFPLHYTDTYGSWFMFNIVYFLPSLFK